MNVKAFLANKLIWFSLLVYLLTGFGGAFGAVWCLHEKVNDHPPATALTCCPDDERSASTIGETDGLQGSGCGPCIDLPLTPPVLKSRIRTARSLGAPCLDLAPPVFPGTFSPANLRLQSSPQQSLAGVSLALIHLRTVVLLN